MTPVTSRWRGAIANSLFKKEPHTMHLTSLFRDTTFQGWQILGCFVGNNIPALSKQHRANGIPMYFSLLKLISLFVFCDQSLWNFVRLLNTFRGLGEGGVLWVMFCLHCKITMSLWPTNMVPYYTVTALIPTQKHYITPSKYLFIYHEIPTQLLCWSTCMGSGTPR